MVFCSLPGAPPRVPNQLLFGQADIRLPSSGIVHGEGLNSMPLLDPVRRIIDSASSSMLYSPGFPRLTGPRTHRDRSFIRTILQPCHPRSRRPGLKAVSENRDRLIPQGCMIKLLITRPSLGCMRGPYVLKILTTRMLTLFLPVIVKEERLRASLPSS